MASLAGGARCVNSHACGLAGPSPSTARRAPRGRAWDHAGVAEAPLERHRRDLRASHADRERAVDFIRRHAVEGRLTTDELADRVGLALSATTVGELDDLVADLPPEPVTPPAPLPAPPAARWQRPGTIRALRFAAIGFFVLTLGAPDGRHGALFAIWIAMLFVLRFARRSERRRRFAARAEARAAALAPPSPDLSEWHPPRADRWERGTSGRDGA